MDRPFKCDACDKTYRLLKSLNHHKNVGHAIKCHPCIFCSKSFGSEVCLQKHYRIYPRVNPINCTCGKSFTRICALYMCKSNHSVEKPFKCPICSMAFPAPFRLAEHQKKHDIRKRRFAVHCEFCQRGFRKQSALDIHRVVHTGEKPFRCEVCHKCFNSPSNLDSHRRVHRRKPYNCEVCGDAFRERKYAIKHSEFHKRESNQYKCEPCGLFFEYTRGLAFHMNQEHNPDNPKEIIDQTTAQESPDKTQPNDVPTNVWTSVEGGTNDNKVLLFVDEEEKSHDDVPGQDSSDTSKSDESEEDSRVELRSNRQEEEKRLANGRILEIELTDVSLEFQFIPANEEADEEEEDCLQINLAQPALELQSL